MFSQDHGEPERFKLVEEVKALNDEARDAEEQKAAEEAERWVFNRKSCHVHMSYVRG